MKIIQPKILTSLAAIAIIWTLVFIWWLPPRWLLSLISQKFPGCVYHAQTTEPLIALTIDDGPDANSTPQLLQVLSRHGAKATFFLISNRVPGNEHLVSEIVRRGHEIGNHLNQHRASILLSPAEFRKALLEAHRVLSRYSHLHWFRPGSGWYNATMISILRQYHYDCALGSVYPFDAWIPWKWFAVQYILHNAHPGSIIVLHDGGSRGYRTAAILEEVLPELIGRGFRIVTLSELFNTAKTDENQPTMQPILPEKSRFRSTRK